MSKNVSR
jgi:hypothetical protein